MAEYTFSQSDSGIQQILNLAQNYVAAPFSSSTNYAVGDYCSRSGNIYRCKTAGASAWSATRWTAVTLGDELSDVNNPISVDSGSSQSVSSGSWTVLQSKSFDAGLYLINYGCSWGASATGYREIGLNTDSANAPSGRLVQVAQGTSGAGTSMSGVRVWNVTATTTFYIWGNQNSGSALNAWPWIEAVKLR